MEDLDRLNNVLRELEQLCVDIKKETVDVMKIIRDEGKDIAQDIQEEKPHLDVDTIVSMLKNASVSLSGDAEKVSVELRVFSVALAHGKDIRECNCEMLKEVWFGDAYDGCSELEGLLALKRDLEGQLENICLETVIDKIFSS